MNRRATGEAAEQRACRFLQSQGLRLVERNYRCRHGEIDLVMREGGELVFVEVRYRRDARFGGAAASVDAGKRARLIAAGLHYLQSKAPGANARFDVIALEGGRQPHWIRNAFDAS